MSDNILLPISRLFYPATREDAIDELRREGVLTEESARTLGEILSAGQYSRRTLFASIAPVKITLDRWVREHRWNKFRPTSALDPLEVYRATNPEVFDGEWLAGKDVLDFGAGQFSPISVAIVLYVNGARSITAFEPGGWKPDHVLTATRELIAELHFRPGPFVLSPSVRAADVKARLADIDFGALTDETDADLGPIKLVRSLDFRACPGSFDLALSNSVFEHVDCFETEIANQLSVLRPAGVSINRVDFTDHRHRKPEHAPFGFYRDGVRAGCNLLRVSDLEGAAKRVGAEFEIKDRMLANPSVIDRPSLLERFAGYDTLTLRTMAATLVLRK
jgi:SAM-dependent methyltransferase